MTEIDRTLYISYNKKTNHIKNSIVKNKNSFPLKNKNSFHPMMEYNADFKN